MASIDFGMVRRQIGMRAVLDLLGFVPTQRRGNQVRGPCPIHPGRSHRNRSFSANLEKSTPAS